MSSGVKVRVSEGKSVLLLRGELWRGSINQMSFALPPQLFAILFESFEQLILGGQGLSFHLHQILFDLGVRFLVGP